MGHTKIEINEESWASVSVSLTSDGETPIPEANIDSIEMTLIESVTGNIVNGRQKQNVLNANNGSYDDSTGKFTWEVQPEDTGIEVPANTPVGSTEPHLATFTVIWDTVKEMHFEIMLLVRNLRSVPQEEP